MIGAAPMPLEVLEFFAAIGIPICEVWGMSELASIATMVPLDQLKLGTVGLARSRGSRSAWPRTARCWSVAAP